MAQWQRTRVLGYSGGCRFKSCWPYLHTAIVVDRILNLVGNKLQTRHSEIGKNLKIGGKSNGGSSTIALPSMPPTQKKRPGSSSPELPRLARPRFPAGRAPPAPGSGPDPEAMGKNPKVSSTSQEGFLQEPLGENSGGYGVKGKSPGDRSF